MVLMLAVGTLVVSAQDRYSVEKPENVEKAEVS
jgi:hypothetical protein